MGCTQALLLITCIGRSVVSEALKEHCILPGCAGVGRMLPMAVLFGLQGLDMHGVSTSLDVLSCLAVA
jgi:hypothetical protein